MVHRHDLVEIRSPKIDQNGYLVADAFPTKVGVFKYVKPNGEITRELRHPDDVFKPDSLETLKNRPIVDEHPDGGPMDAGNTRGLSRGHVGEQVTVVGDHVKANLVVTDQDMIAKMQGKNGVKKSQLSCGYTADVIPEVGTFKGQDYDHRQTNIVYNHLASVWKGRAGPTAAIHLDAEDAAAEDLSIEDYDGERRKSSNPCHPNAKKRRKSDDMENFDRRIEDAGGVGSRGGVVIGTTGSGKPIYKSHGHSGHKGFTKSEHNTAANVHRELGQQQNDKDAKEGKEKISAEAKHHFAEATKHMTSGAGGGFEKNVTLSSIQKSVKESHEQQKATDPRNPKPGGGIVTPQVGHGVGGPGQKQGLALGGIPKRKDDPYFIIDEETMTIKMKREAVSHGDYRQDAFSVEFPAEAEAAVNKISGKLDSANQHIENLQAKADAHEKDKKKAEGERDQANENLDALKKKGDAIDPAQLDAMADERADVKGVAHYLKVSDYADKANPEIKAMIVKAVNPDLKMDGLDPMVIEGRYQAICDGIRKDNKGRESLASLKQITSPIHLDGDRKVTTDGDDDHPERKYAQDMEDLHTMTPDQIKAKWSGKSAQA